MTLGTAPTRVEGKKRDLHHAYAQLLNYADDLENPPLLIVFGMETFKVHTHFTNSVQVVHNISLDDLLEPQNPPPRHHPRAF